MPVRRAGSRGTDVHALAPRSQERHECARIRTASVRPSRFRTAAALRSAVTPHRLTVERAGILSNNYIDISRRTEFFNSRAYPGGVAFSNERRIAHELGHAAMGI